MSDDEETCGFTINKAYAERYNNWRQKEEIQRLKSKHGDVDLDDESDSSSSESEDDDASALTPQVEKDWFKTLAALKAKDPRIYDKNAKFYGSDESDSDSSDDESKSTRKKDKPMFLKDYERKVILEKGGVVSESEDDDEIEKKTLKAGYYEKLDEINQSITAATAQVDSDSDEEFLVHRNKSTEEEEKEETEYRDWLKGRKDLIEHDNKVQQDLAPLKELWNDPKLSAGEKFLRDYILNKRYKEDDDERIPTYEELIEDENLSEDEQLVENQETFERKYNFRFEEPDQDFIKSYPRTVGDSLRRKDDRRTKKRKEVMERKESEKKKKREEMKQLKNMKRREIMAKIDQLRDITGNKDIGISEGDVEGDFDPKKYDEMMKKAFDNDYYDEDEEGKPVFPYDEELDQDNWDKWTKEEGTEDHSNYNADEPVAGPSGEQDNNEPSCEDPDFNMDADYDPSQDYTHGLNGRYKKKRKSKFRQAVEQEKPVFDPKEKSFEEYFDEYYKLDYEDMIGDLPCRFKYRKVPANDYGLEVEEILTCNDKELNAWVSLKKMSQHKTAEEDMYEKRLFRKKAKNRQKKLNILQSLQEPEEEEPEQQNAQSEANAQGKKKRKRQKKGQKIDNSGETVALAGESADTGKQADTDSTPTGNPKKRKTQEESLEGEEESKKEESSKKEIDVSDESAGEAETTEKSQNVEKRGKSTSPKKGKDKKKKKQKAGTMSDERLKAFGINPKKFKYTHLPRIKEQRKAVKQNKKVKL